MGILLALLMFGGCWMLGSVFMRRLPCAEPGEHGALSILTGIMMLICTQTLLAFLGWIHTATAWGLLAIFWAAGILGRKQSASTAAGPPWNSLLRRPLGIFSAAVLGLLIALGLTLCLLPPTRTDALVYHFAIPKAYLDHHGIVALPNNLYSFFALPFEMFYLWALALGGETTAALAGWGTTLLLLYGMTLFYRRRFSSPGGPTPLLVPAVFLTTPTFFDLGVSGYVDLGAATFVFYSFYAWDRWREEDHPGWPVLAAFCAAAAVAVKLTTAPAFALSFIGVALVAQGRGKNPAWGLRLALLYAGAALIFLLPWWIKNFLQSGNPFVPLLMDVFDVGGRINWDAQRSAMFQSYIHAFGMGRGLKELALLPIHLTFFARRDHLWFDGTIGIVFLLLLPCLWFLRRCPETTRDTVRALGLAAAVCFAWWFSHFQYVRFLGFFFTFLALLSVYGLQRLLERLAHPAARRAAAFAVAAGIACNTALIASGWLEARPWAHLLGAETRDAFLERRVPLYPMYREFNRALEKNDKALFVFMRNLGYLAEKPFHSDSIFEAHTLQKLLAEEDTADGLLRQLLRLGFTHILFDSRFVFGASAALSPEEQEILRGLLGRHAREIASRDGVFLYRLVLN